MANKNIAMQKIIDGSFKKGFEELAESFEADGADEKMIADLREGFFVPNLAQMRENFSQNIRLLENYPYIFTKEFVEPDKNRYILFPINEKLYYCYDSEDKRLFPIDVNSDHETKYFFENLDNPLFVENELNEFNLKFLEDNVRDSRDFAEDNHIYLWYENAEYFSLLLYYGDLNPLVEHEKFVILIGEERSKYPLNFKAEFGIDYNSMTPQKIRIEEMKRICYWVTRYNQGITFSCDVLNQNQYIFADVKLEDCALIRYKGAEIWRIKSVIDILKEINKKYSHDLFQKLSELVMSNDVKFICCDDPGNDFKDSKLFRQKVLELLNGAKCYLNKQSFTLSDLIRACILYMYYSKAPDVNPRITPTILFAPDWTNDDAWSPFVLTFPYYKAINSIREQIISVGQHIRAYDAVDILGDYGILNRLPTIYYGMYSVFKFEDLKIYPEETSRALCKYLWVPYDPKMIEDPAFDEYEQLNTSHNPGKPKSRFDKTAVYRNVDDILTKFDQVRLQIFYDPVLRHYGYPAFDFESCPMTDNDIAFLLKFPFKFEKSIRFFIFNTVWHGRVDSLEEIRRVLYKQMLDAWRAAKQGQFKFPPVIRPEFDEKKGGNA